MQFAKAILQYDDQTVELPSNKMTFFDELYVDFKEVDQGDFRTFHLAIHPKQPIQLKKISLVFQQVYSQNDNTRILCNGFQSWSESREVYLNEKIRRPGIFAKNRKYFGDEHIAEIPRGKNMLHSWTYTHVKNSKEFNLLGSLKEHSAFTYFVHDTQNNTLTMEKECAGLELGHSFPIVDLFVGKGKEETVYDNYFTAMELSPLRGKRGTGWTSWNNYSTNISEEIILKNLRAFEDKNVPLDYFQIDNGYQTQVGDWLNIKSNFPNGMASIAQKIKQSNYRPGIWMAPFVCSESSEIFKQKKDWLTKAENGSPLAIGNLKLKGGKFYALDFYVQDVQNYLTKVIHTFTKKWGFEFLKMDFLFAVCILSQKNKTRGQIMNDALEFLKTTAGDALILGSGVPIGSAFGKVDFCRVGCDVHLSWENSLPLFFHDRERNSTLLNLRSTLGRWQLNKRAFLNDPDVFILRNENNKLSSIQQYTALIINALCGGLVFTSDFVGDYSAEQWSEFEMVFELQKSTVFEVQNLGGDRYVIHYKLDGKRFAAACNLGRNKTTFSIEKRTIELEAFETLLLG